MKLSKSFEPEAPHYSQQEFRNRSWLSVPRAVSGTENSALAPPVAKRQALETIGNVQTNKRKREPPLDLSRPRISSDDGRRRSKKVKVDCDCDTDHSWWMSIKIDEMNEAIQRLDGAMNLVRELEPQSRVITGTLIELLKNSREILEDAQGDMRAEGGRDRDDSE